MIRCSSSQYSRKPKIHIIGPGLLQPVDENNLTKWKELLEKREKLDSVSLESKIPSAHKSQYLGGGDDDGHCNS